VRLTDLFPTGNKAVVDIRIVPKLTGDPNALKLKTGSPGKKFKFSLAYFVPYDAIPVDARPSFALGSPARRSASFVSFPASAPTGGDPNGVQVLIKGLVESVRGEQSDNFLKEMDKKLKTPKLDKLNNKLKAATLVNDLLAMGLDLRDLLAELDALEECAKNPTNPLTKKTNKENPADRDKLLKEIAGVRAELEGNTAAGVIGTINSAASGFIPNAPGWLGHVIGPGTAWALENFKKVAQDRMNEIRKGVVPCENDFKINAVLEGLWTLTGVKCGGPEGKWEIDGVVTGGGISGKEHIVVSLEKGSLSGPWSSTGEVSAAGSTVAINESGTAKLTLSDDKKSGTLDFSPGAVPVTVGSFCRTAPTG
jgi:hypothetical protein